MSSTSSKKTVPDGAALEWRGERLVPIGEIVGTHGVNGELRLRPFNPSSSALSEVTEVFLVDGGPVALRRVRPHGRVWLVHLEVADSPEAARAFVGRTVAIRERELPPLGEAEYYHYQLIGLEVVEESGRTLGAVTEVIATGASDVLAVATAAGERLVPMVDEIVRRVDVAAGRIVIRAPEGLLEV
ncbi:MAG: ribosome maturation factor RimM [Candidatus Binatia bacterium]